MSAEESNPVIDQLKQQINSLETELIRFKLIAKSFQKYFDYFNEINETIDSNEVLLNLKNEIIDLKEDQNLCFVSVEKLSENQLNQLKFQTNVGKTYVKTRDISTQTEITKTNYKFRAKVFRKQTKDNRRGESILVNKEEVFQESYGRIRCIRSSCKQWFPNKIALNIHILTNHQNYDIKQEINEQNIESEERNLYSEEMNGVTEGFQIQEIVSNYNKNTGSLRTNRKRNLMSISSDLEDNDIKIEDNSDTDFDLNDVQMSDSSDYKNELKNTFQCNVKDCSYSGRTKKDLRRHKREIHSNKTQDSKEGYVCEYIGCGKQFKNKDTLSAHQQIHSGRQFKCQWKDCTADFALKKYLDRHMNVHKGTYRCTVEGCSFLGRDKTNLRVHEESHSEHRQHKCLINDCNQQFRSRYNLKKHQLRAHPQEFDDIPWLECTQNDCNFKTKAKSYFDQHLKQHIRPFSCKECEKSFPTSKQLSYHQSTHSSELKIRCDWYGCDRLFISKQAMLDHMNNHTLEISHSCHWPGCDKTYSTKIGLNGHILKAHKGVTEFVCPHCDYKNRRPHRLRDHITRKHENQTIQSKLI